MKKQIPMCKEIKRERADIAQDEIQFKICYKINPITGQKTPCFCTNGRRISKEKGMIELEVNNNKIIKDQHFPFAIDKDPFTHKIIRPKIIKIMEYVIPEEAVPDYEAIVNKQINIFIDEIRPILKDNKYEKSNDNNQLEIRDRIKTIIQKEMKPLIEEEIKKIIYIVVQRIIKEKVEEIIQKEIKQVTQKIIRNIIREKVDSIINQMNISEK